MLLERGRAPEAQDRTLTGAPATAELTWHVFLLAAVSALALFSRFLHSDSYWTYFEDDFFYYALVAKNLALKHLSTFDGTHLTNGYHPLWLLVLTGLYRIFPGLSFLLAVQAVGLLATLAFYFASLRCFRYLGTSPSLQRPAALVLSLHTLLLFRYGMEITLTLPLGIVTLAFILSPQFRWTMRQTLCYGLLASLTILSRLDAAFLILLLLIAQTAASDVPWKERVRRLVVFGAGGALFPIYLATNLVFFHTLLPISGVAKQLKPLFPPSAVPITNFFLYPDRAKMAFAYPALLVIVVGACAFFRERRGDRDGSGAILGALFLFPAVHLAAMCLVSDWPLWPWYYYSLTFAVLAGTVVLLRYRRPEEQSARPRAAASAPNFRVQLGFLYVATLLISLYVAAYSVGKKPPAFALFSGYVAEFSRTHPGTYAMGDCAGSAAFRSDSPVIQLEGLMMDRSYVELVRARTPLREVLQRYHADYYATIENPVHRDGCFMVHEPNQAGPTSPKMLGKVCAQPLSSRRIGGQSVGIFRASDVLAP